MLVGLWWAPLGVALLWWSQDPRLFGALAPLPILLAACVFLPRALAGRGKFSQVIGLTVLAHLLAGTGLILALLL